MVHESLKEGMTVTRPFTVVKVNSKSVVLEDSKGNRTTVRDRDYAHYFKGVQAKAINGYNKSNETSTPTTGTHKASGRMPNWANTQDKQKFVVMCRQNGTTPSAKAYGEYKNSK